MGWLKDLELANNVELVKHVNRWGKQRDDVPDLMVKWDAATVAEAVQVAQARLSELAESDRFQESLP